MDIGFVFIMLTLIMAGMTYIYLTYRHHTRRCKNCNFYKHKMYFHYGTCSKSGLQQWEWDACKFFNSIKTTRNEK